MRSKKSRVGIIGAALIVVTVGLSAVMVDTASAAVVNPTSSGPATCPPNIPGGGGCHYWSGASSVAGSTGNFNMTVYYKLSTGGNSFNVYRWCAGNSTSRTQNLIFVTERQGSTAHHDLDNNLYPIPHDGSSFCLNEGAGFFMPRNSGWLLQYGVTNTGIPGHYDANVGLWMN